MNKELREHISTAWFYINHKWTSDSVTSIIHALVCLHRIASEQQNIIRELKSQIEDLERKEKQR